MPVKIYSRTETMATLSQGGNESAPGLSPMEPDGYISPPMSGLALEQVAKFNHQIPYEAPCGLMNLVVRGRLAPEDQKDPLAASAVTVATRAEI